MGRRKKDIDFGQGECQYRFCDLPGKKFPKSKEDQKFCCTLHRLAEWNLQNPRIKKGEDAKKQEPLPLGVVIGSELETKNETVDRALKSNATHAIFIEDKKPKRPGSHAAKLDKSDRLQKTHEILKTGPKTTKQISNYTGSEAVHSDIHELRQNGIDIPPAKYLGKSETGRKIYQYQLN